jgi:hypothetical protein
MVRHPRNHHSCQPSHAATVTPPSAAVNAIKVYVTGTREDFRSEPLRMMRAHGVEFDERYVFG